MAEQKSSRRIRLIASAPSGSSYQAFSQGNFTYFATAAADKIRQPPASVDLSEKLSQNYFIHESLASESFSSFSSGNFSQNFPCASDNFQHNWA